MNILAIWIQVKEVIIDFVKYGFPAIALILSLLSYIDSRKANKVRNRLNKIEEKLKYYELEEKEKEREEASKAMVEARIVNISKNKYRLKIWNSGRGTAYNVDFKVPGEAEGMIWREKVPYEFLEPGKNFEENVLVYSGTPRKFKVTLTWDDGEDGHEEKDQILSI